MSHVPVARRIEKKFDGDCVLRLASQKAVSWSALPIDTSLSVSLDRLLAPFASHEAI